MMDLIIKNATLVSDGVSMTADVAAAQGRIVAIGALGATPATEIVDGSGRIVMPGLVDLGIGPPDDSAEPDLDLLTREAVAGGVTTVIAALPCAASRPFADVMAERRARDNAEAVVDFGYHYVLDDWTDAAQRHLRAAVTQGAASVWVSRAGLDAAAPGAALVHAAMRELPEGVCVIARPSDPVFERHHRALLRSSKQTGPRAHAAVFPEWTEEQAVHTLASCARGAKARLMILGLSSREALKAFARAREEGVPLVGAVALPHLIFSAAMLDEETAPVLPLVWPPLRDRADQQALWSALEDGLLQAIVSDHRPLTVAQTRRGQSDVLDGPEAGGLISHLLPMLHGEGISKWRLSWEALSQCACADPAKLAGLYPKKGALQIGSDADIVLLNPDDSEHRPKSANGERFDPYAGREVQGVIEGVWVRAKRVWQDGRPVEPVGKLLDRRVSLEA